MGLVRLGGGGDKSTKKEHNILMADELQERDLPKNSEILSMGCDQIHQGTVEYLGWGVTRDLTRNSGVLRMWWDQRFAKEQWST